jgi:hypothetical protein
MVEISQGSLIVIFWALDASLSEERMEHQHTRISISTVASRTGSTHRPRRPPESRLPRPHRRLHRRL